MRVFLSSTCYDLADVRAVLESYLQKNGHVALLSDRLTFPVDASQHRHAVCTQVAQEADLFVLVIDRRYGAPCAQDPTISITHAEFRAAAGKVPMIGFVRRVVWDERHTFDRSSSRRPKTVDDVRTFDLLDEIQSHDAGVWLVTQFDHVNDIITCLDSLQTKERSGWLQPETIEEFLRRFYSLDTSDTQTVRLLSFSEPTTSPGLTQFMTKAPWTALRVPIEEVKCALVEGPAPPSDPDPLYSRSLRSRLELQGVQLWNDPCYRLMSFDVSETEASFSLSTDADTTGFLNYRFSAGAMAEELRDASRTQTADEILANRSVLKRRQKWMPDCRAVETPGKRFCAGGVAGVFAIARGTPHNDFLIPLHIRTDSVSENRGFSSASFNGYHQWLVDARDELHLKWTIFRELYEEVFGGDEVRWPSKRVKHDWYIAEPFIEYVANTENAVVCELTAFGFNALVGNWECPVTLAVLNPEYWEMFGSCMKYNWEAKKVVPVSSKDPQAWARALGGPWGGDSLLSVVRGLSRLRELDASRVTINLDALITNTL
jgi:uncharacterized protein DUF4062